MNEQFYYKFDERTLPTNILQAVSRTVWWVDAAVQLLRSQRTLICWRENTSRTCMSS